MGLDVVLRTLGLIASIYFRLAYFELRSAEWTWSYTVLTITATEVVISRRAFIASTIHCLEAVTPSILQLSPTFNLLILVQGDDGNEDGEEKREKTKEIQTML